MGLCQSADGVMKRRGNGNGDAAEPPCPTVFELERIIDARRAAAKRLQDNLVNIEFRRGLFEVYHKGYASSSSDDDDDDDRGDGDGYGGGGIQQPVDMMATIGGYAAAAANPGVGAGRRRDWADTGEVFVATHKCTGTAYAVREVAVPASRSAREVDDVWKRFDAQAALDHPNICRLQEIFCSEGRYYAVTDLCSGGDVMARLAAQGRTSYEEREAAALVGKIAGALRHCHSEGVVHGNLRVESCHFEDMGRWADIKIVDAGLNRPPPPTTMHMSLSRAPGASGSTTTTWGGSAHSSNGLKRRRKTGWYMPPEVRSGGGACTEAGDAWMLGVLTWLILTGPLPQPGMSQEAAWASIMVGRPFFRGQGWAGRSVEAVDFVSRLLQKEATKRMSVEEALEHPWLAPTGASSSAGGAVAGGRGGIGCAGGGDGGDALVLPPSICSSLHAFKESCVMRRLGLRLVGRTLQAVKLLPAKEAFALLDPYGKGYVTEDALAKVHALRGADNSTEVAHEVFEAMDPEGSGRVGFSTFLAACLAGRCADEAGARVAFSWLDRRRRDAINSEDMKLFTGQVLPLRDLEEAFTDAHDALDLMSTSNAGPAGAAVREMEARRSAASGAAGGFTYAEFYRLLASAPPPPSSLSRGSGSDSDSDSVSSATSSSDKGEDVEADELRGPCR